MWWSSWDTFLLRCLPFLVPIIIFCAKPSSPKWWRAGRLLIALALLWPVNVGLRYLEVQREYSKLMASFDATPDSQYWVEIDGACLHFAIMGWFWALLYTAFWEVIWRWRYRKHGVAISNGLGDDSVSNCIVMLALNAILLVTVIIIYFVLF